MNLLVVLILSIVSILFLLVGNFIILFTRNSKKVMAFSVSLGFVVLTLLGILHLIPDAYEFFSLEVSRELCYIFLLIFTFLGFIIILIFDRAGGHHHDKESHNHEKEHMEHISLITCVFLFIHNFIEGMTLYSSVLLSYSTAIILTLGIGLHNIPLGLTLSSTFSKIYSKFKSSLIIIFIGLSYLFGALVAYIFKETFTNAIVFGVILSFTFGMVLYIAIFEFLPLMKDGEERKAKIMGLISGFILMLITLFI